MEEHLQKHIDIAEQLSQVLGIAREEYTTLSNVDLIKAGKEELDRYFQRLGMLRRLIGSLESFLHEEHKTRLASEESLTVH